MENYAIGKVSVAPMRSASTHKSEQVSQLLFGEIGRVLDRQGKRWCKIECASDKIIGWVDYQQIALLTPQEVSDYGTDFSFCIDLFQPANIKDTFLPLTLGARLPKSDGLQFEFLGQRGNYAGRTLDNDKPIGSAQQLLQFANYFVNAPQQNGGRSPLGIDSSGLVQLLYRLAGIQLPRTASEQVFLGENVHFMEQTAPGDLFFFVNRAGKIDHVGLLNLNGDLLHVWGRGRVDKVDHYGWFDTEENRYRHKLRVVRRLLEDVQPIWNLNEKRKTEIATTQMPLFES